MSAFKDCFKDSVGISTNRQFGEITCFAKRYSKTGVTVIYGDSVYFTWCRMYSLKTFLISQLPKHTPHHLPQGYHRNTYSSREQKAWGLGRTHVLIQDAIQVPNGKHHSRHAQYLTGPPTAASSREKSLTGTLSHPACERHNFHVPWQCEMVPGTHLSVQELFPV